MPHRSHPWFVASALLLLCAPIPPARADVGPRLEEPQVRIRVLRGGKPLSASVKYLLLAPRRPGGGEWSGPQHPEGPMLEALEEGSLPDGEGGSWAPFFCSGWVREDLGGVQFQYFRLGYPQRVRLAAYLPQEDRLFITDEAPTRHYITDLTADLSEDGGGTLTPSSSGSVALVLGVLRENVSGLGVALLMTVAIELVVLTICVAVARQWGRMGRLAVLCVVGNLLTLPAVWFLSVYGKVEFDLNRALLVFLLGELAAVCFEGLLYARAGGVRLGPALLWSFLANAATFLVGCGLVGLTV